MWAICRDTQQLKGCPGDGDRFRRLRQPGAGRLRGRRGHPSIASITSTVATKTSEHKLQAWVVASRAHQGISWLHHEPTIKGPLARRGAFSDGGPPFSCGRRGGDEGGQADTLSPRERVRVQAVSPPSSPISRGWPPGDGSCHVRHGAKAAAPAGRSGWPILRPGCASSCTQGTPAALPSGMPGMALLMLGRWQAPHP